MVQVHLTQTNLLTIASGELEDVGSERIISLWILRTCQRVDREVGLTGLQANQCGLVRHTLHFIAVRVPMRRVVLFLPIARDQTGNTVSSSGFQESLAS